MLLTGDFFVYPRRVIFDLEAELKDIPADMRTIEERVTRFFQGTRAEIPDITPSDFVGAIGKALEKVRLTDLGIPLSLTNRIFTVNGSFVDVARKSPRHLLLPYCAKPLECGYRYRKECPECGECSIGEAYRIGRERGMWVTTIQSFEDLMTTLKDFKSERVACYVGCCCEAFYSKHLEDFEKSGIPGILVDIDNTTCYELGKEEDAYAGNFENQTDVDVSLLTRVLDVQV
jgi:lipoate-protein ligase A